MSTSEFYYVTFGAKYAHESHSSGLPITDKSFLKIEATDEDHARRLVQEVIGGEWAFIYDPESFAPQVARHDLVEVDTELVDALRMARVLWEAGRTVTDTYRRQTGLEQLTNQFAGPMPSWADLTVNRRAVFWEAIKSTSSLETMVAAMAFAAAMSEEEALGFFTEGQ